jgi:hypothetical protein
MNKLLAALAGAVLLSGCNQGTAEPAESVKQLMANKVQPTAKTYWDAVQFISDEAGDHDITPGSDAEWERTRKAAADLQEYGKLLLTPEYTEGREPNWSKFAQGLIDVSKKAEQAAAKQDPEAVFEVGGTVYSVCSACHQAYPAETSEPAASGSNA